MTPEQIKRIPAALLAEHDTAGLRGWLYARGLRMSLAELEAERKRRQVRPDRKDHR